MRSSKIFSVYQIWISCMALMLGVVFLAPEPTPLHAQGVLAAMGSPPEPRVEVSWDRYYDHASIEAGSQDLIRLASSRLAQLGQLPETEMPQQRTSEGIIFMFFAEGFSSAEMRPPIVIRKTTERIIVRTWLDMDPFLNLKLIYSGYSKELIIPSYPFRALGGLILNFFIRDTSVVGGVPNNCAAPLFPKTFPPVFLSACKIFS